METVPGIASSVRLAGLALGLTAAACVPGPEPLHSQAVSPEPTSITDTPAAVSASPSATAQHSEPTAEPAHPLPTLAPAPPIPIPALEASFEAPARSTRRADAESSLDVETRSVNVGSSEVAASCVVGGADAECTPLGDGPFIITDYEALDGCRDRLYLASVPFGESKDEHERLMLDWTVGVSTTGVHGARIAVAPDARLVAVLQPQWGRPSHSPRCTITWSGHRPGKAPRSPTQPALMESPYR